MASDRERGGRDRPDHGGAVGYGRPPEQHRFRPGEPSRNPHGRRGRPREVGDAASTVPDFLDGLVTVSVDGKPTRMTRSEAVDHALFSRALKGDNGAARQLDRRRDERARRRAAAGAAPAHSADAETDAAIVARALARQAGGPATRSGAAVPDGGGGEG